MFPHSDLYSTVNLDSSIEKCSSIKGAISLDTKIERITLFHIKK
jgi:hypothetical protein